MLKTTKTGFAVSGNPTGHASEAHVFSPIYVETFHINTAFLNHNSSFKTGAVQEKGDCWSQGGVLSSPIFYRVCFYIFVFCLSYHVQLEFYRLWF